MIPGWARGIITISGELYITPDSNTHLVISVNDPDPKLTGWRKAAIIIGNLRAPNLPATEQDAIAYLWQIGFFQAGDDVLRDIDYNGISTLTPGANNHAEQREMRWTEAKGIAPLAFVSSNSNCSQVCQPLYDQLSKQLGWKSILDWTP
jgi:hypothetical protein